MVSSDLALGAAGLLTAKASEPRSLSQLAVLATRQVTGCVAANVMLWRDDEPSVVTASHPDTSRLIGVQLRSGRGAVIDAHASGNPVSCADTLTDQRWPEYSAAALRLGVRCSATPPSRGDPVAFTLSLYGARPRVLDPDQIPLAELLVAFGGAALAAVSEHDDPHRTPAHLRAP